MTVESTGWSLEGVVGGVRRIYPLAGGEVSIGRGTNNSIVLADTSVSRRHARLVERRGAWEIEDQGSTNGVAVNGETRDHARLAVGDVLRIGAFELQVVAARDAAPAAMPAPRAAAPSAAASEPSSDRSSPEVATAPGLDAVQGTIVRPLAEFAASYGLTAASTAAAHSQEKRLALDQAYGNRIFGYLTRLASLLQQAESVDQVLARVTEIAFEALPIDRGFILLLDERGEAVCELARSGERLVRRPKGEVPVSRSMLEAVMRDRVAVITFDAQTDSRWQGGLSIQMHKIRAAMCVPLWSAETIIGVMQVDTPFRAGAFTERDLDFLTALANYAAVAVERLRFAERAELEKRLRGRLERYHSPSVIEEVMRQEQGIGDLARLRPAEVTVLFADIVGFTAVTESARPGEVAELLAAFFDTAVEAIFAAGGTLDKFIGDCVMAFFGAPMAQGDHALRAVRAAIDIQRGLAAWNERRGDGASPLLARVAINSGPVVVGEMGSSRRVEYTVLGNAVNVASRLEEQVATPGDVVLGGETERLLAGAIATEPLGELPLRGLSQRVAAFRVRPCW